MGASILQSHDVIGNFYHTLQQDEGNSWVPAISMLFTSDQDTEQYGWLGQSPAMQEWVGGRHAKGFRENNLTIKNKHYEATLEILLKDMRRDKTGQIMARVAEMAQRTNAHWASILSTLIVNGESTTCYDGQYFFDTDHNEGDSGAQSNDLSVDISGLPSGTSGSTTSPSVEEMQLSVIKGIQQIYGLKDDQGEPMNEMASNFLVMTPPSLWQVASSAFNRQQTDINQLVPANLNISVVANARLSDWTDKFGVFRTDGSVKPFIRQQETDVDLKVKDEMSDFAFDNDAIQVGVDTWRNVGYGYWQQACLVTMT